MYNPQLETFLRVADAGSFNKAAAQLHITPTAVIKQINLLELQFGIELFERSHRGLTLTKAGISLYKDSKYIVGYCRDAIARARNAVKEDTNVIRIGISPLTPAQILMELWPKIHALCPEIKFQLVPFENTQENTEEILANLGEKIDVVAGIVDEILLEVRKCDGFEISRKPLCCVMSLNHRLAEKNSLRVQDLYGENLLLMHRGWSRCVDNLRDHLCANHAQIHIVDFDFYDVGIFNQCENSNDLLMAVADWGHFHPLLKVLPVEWEHSAPYGLLHSKTPSGIVGRFLTAVQSVMDA